MDIRASKYTADRRWFASMRTECLSLLLAGDRAWIGVSLGVTALVLSQCASTSARYALVVMGSVLVGLSLASDLVVRLRIGAVADFLSRSPVTSVRPTKTSARFTILRFPTVARIAPLTGIAPLGAIMLDQRDWACLATLCIGALCVAATLYDFAKNRRILAIRHGASPVVAILRHGQEEAEVVVSNFDHNSVHVSTGGQLFVTGATGSLLVGLLNVWPSPVDAIREVMSAVNTSCSESHVS